jgi:hypothetical protein
MSHFSDDEVAGFPGLRYWLEDPAVTAVGTTSVSQLGAAGLVAGGSERALALATELVREWERGEQSDFAWLMSSSGITWPVEA